ncbi:patatin-like phospholipase family protein, partial [bacterium]|nr:patatin-like phospholipase family protein [bacterium]
MPLKNALVLTGGGARGAYQAGAMRAIGEIVRRNKIDRPFDIFCGNSAGAINSAFLASQVHQFSAGCDRLCDFWESLTTDQIYKTDFKSLLGRGARWVWELSTGGLYERKLVRSLLDTSPLLRLIHREIDFSKIESNIRDGLADAIAITAVSYSTGDSRTFFQSHQGVRAWEKVRRDSVATTLLPKHVMASSAIPILFPPVKLGDDYFGDGSLRNYTPMSPAIHLGADRILVIGVRCKYCMGETHAKQPSLGRILSVILNYVLLDAIDYDYENLTR